jgi:two-component system, sensor histidine kinase PdtaS
MSIADIIDLNQFGLTDGASEFERRSIETEDMTTITLHAGAGSTGKTAWGRRSAASYERELTQHRATESRLRQALAKEEGLVRKKSEQLQQQEVAGEESDHRLLNGLQLVVSLLSLQSRMSANAETASQLAVAADRVATIERVHRRLHRLDGVQSVKFKNYLEEFCRDFSAMLTTGDSIERAIIVEGTEIDLPAATAIPLSFIANELITNAAKYGTGPITVRLEERACSGCALSVCTGGASLPEGFDPAASNGLGMKIVRSFIKQIDGELQTGRNANNQGTRFTVLFS